jgi:hypothetical protein
VALPSSGSKNKPSKKTAKAFDKIRQLFDSANEGGVKFSKALLFQYCRALNPRRSNSSQSPQGEFQIQYHLLVYVIMKLRLVLKEEQSLKVSESEVQSRILGHDDRL